MSHRTVSLVIITPTEILNQLAVRFKPVVYLDSDEEYYPCSIEYFFSHSTYYRDNQPLYAKGQITPTTLPESAKPGDALIVDRDFYNGTENLIEVPIYAYPRDVVLEDGSEVVQISYCFIYTYNGPKYIFGCIPVGAHQGDVEHVTVELKKNSCSETGVKSYEITRVYFGAHKSDDGLWVAREDCEYTRRGQLVVYSAAGSHASYPHARDYIRCVGCADDYTNGGVRWNGPLVVIDSFTEWNNWPGHLGSEPTPGHHGWWHYENETSTNWFRRTFCICR